MGNPVNWFEIYVDDIQRARAFYESVFEVTLAPLEGSGSEMPMLAFLGEPGGPGACGSLVKMDGCAPGGNSTIVYFSCADCAVQAARATAAGGRVERPKFSIGPYGHVALVLDTEGNMIGLHSMQ
jgi:hypothetical protein